MIGNVVFLGFALAGAPGLSAPASIAALGAFLTGAVAGGRIVVHVDLVMPLGVAAVLLAAGGIAAHRLSAGAPDWA